MPVKLRLQRHGKKGKPFYWIVAADARAKRDGKYLEKLGTYNPNTNPATIDLNVDGAVQWLQNGAQPTSTTRAILSFKGALYKKHLLGGVRKGAFSLEVANEKFHAWITKKERKVKGKVNSLVEAEKAVNEARIASLRKFIEEDSVVESQENTKEGVDSNLYMPYSTQTEITVLNLDGNNLKKDSTYTFNMVVKIEDDYDREELLSSFRYMINAPSLVIDGVLDNPLSFENNKAISTFNAKALKIGDSKMHIFLLQNFQVVDTLEVELNIA